MSRFVRPETRTLILANGDQLIVRARLTAGEQRAASARLWTYGPDGGLRRNAIAVLEGAVVAYLLDWNMRDDDGQAVSIRDLPADDLQRVLDNLDPVDYDEIKTAIETHERTMYAERAAEKKTDGEKPS